MLVKRSVLCNSGIEAENMLVKRSVLCNSGIEAENHFLHKSLAACEDSNSKLTMYLYSKYSF